MTGSARDSGAARVAAIVTVAFFIIIAILVAAVFWQSYIGNITYMGLQTEFTPKAKPPEIIHLKTPVPVKAVYITACTGSEKTLRDKVLDVIADTKINSMVIDLKDYTGTVSYASTSMRDHSSGYGCRIMDLPQFLKELHAKGIYAIARVTTFQDPLYASEHPEVAVISKADPRTIWRDTKGLAYVDPGAKIYWDYIIGIGKEAYSIGFDELNFDYIRFPSDGNLNDALYSWSAGKTKAEVVKDFFIYLRERFAGSDAILSADLFGLTTSAEDDMGIGQVLGDALVYFDYVSPMVYPSHFASGFDGFAKPAEHPYDVVKYSMDHAITKALNASTTPDKLRPWLQSFDLGAVYTPDMVKAQMKAVYDSGLDSWMLWNAGSVYNKESLEFGH